MPSKNIFGIDINYADYSSDRKASVYVTQPKLRHESNQLNVGLYSQNSINLSDNINLLSSNSNNRNLILIISRKRLKYKFQRKCKFP